MKNLLTFPALGNNFLNSLRDVNDEPIHTYNNPFMQNFVRQSIKGVRCTALNQYYKSSISNEVFKNTSKT